jgi:hypothetical protein
LIGVNVAVRDSKKLKAVMDREKLPWRSFADQGMIFDRWNLSGTPTYYIIDRSGVIRHKWVGSPGESVIRSALEPLIQEVERSGARGKPDHG